MEEKLHNSALIALEITSKNEMLQTSLWDKVINHIIENKVKDPKKYVTDMYNIIIPSNI